MSIVIIWGTFVVFALIAVVSAILFAKSDPDMMPISLLVVLLGLVICALESTGFNMFSESSKSYDTISEMKTLAPLNNNTYFRNNSESKELTLHFAGVPGEETFSYENLEILTSSGPATAIIEYYESKISEDLMDMKLAGKISKITLYLPES